jgi:hypothetical protein
MLSDIKSGIQLLILAMFIGLVAYFGSGVYDKIPGMLAIPEKAQSESAKYTAERNRVLAESNAMLTAVPTLQYLSIQGTASAIENERIKARAQADAQVVAAQGQADASRTLANSVVTFVVVIGIGVVGFFLLRFVGGLLSFSVVNKAIDGARRDGGAVLLPNGHEVRYLGPGSSHSTPRSQPAERVRQLHD